MFEVGTHVEVIANTFNKDDAFIGLTGTVLLHDHKPYNAKALNILVGFDQEWVMPFKADELRAIGEQQAS